MGLFQLAGLRMHTGGAHGWCSRVGRLHVTRAQESGALHALLPTGPPWYHLGAAAANYVCASPTAHAVGVGCAACSESQWQRAPTLSVASVVECPRLATGLAVSIEASPELLGVSPSAGPKTQAGAAAPRVNGAGVEISKTNTRNAEQLKFP